MKKVVLKVEFYHDRIKQKAMKAASGISGVESVSVDTKDNRMTLTGEIDPVSVVEKLRKMCNTQIISVGPAKEEKKKKDDQKNKPDPKAPAPVPAPAPALMPVPCDVYGCICDYGKPQYYYLSPAEEDPRGCVIC